MSESTVQQMMQGAMGAFNGGRIVDAQRLCEQVLFRDARHVDAIFLLGLIALRERRFSHAVERMGLCAELAPNFAPVRHHLASALLGLGREDEAIDALQSALRLQSNFPEAATALGGLLMRRRRFDEAVACFGRVAQSHPNHFEAHNNLGIALAEAGRLEESVASLRRAIALRPDSPDTLRNLGKALATQQKIGLAIEVLQAAVRLRPNFPKAFSDLGVALAEAGRLDEATTAFGQAIALSPDFAAAHFYAALALLLSGDFARGWKEYEWRWLAEGFPSPRRNFRQPLWNGDPLDGKSILLHAEQGFGDTLQFVRLAPEVARRGGSIVLECQPELVELLRPIAGVGRVVPAGQPLPAFDVHCPLLSLPGILGIALDTIPATTPYLKADATKTERWAKRVQSGAEKLRVGIAWAGSATHPRDKTRSMSINSFAPLMTMRSDAHFFSLQKGPAESPMMPPPPGRAVANLAPELRDFSDTAAAVVCLDLIVCVDTSVAHLAGALGRPVWVMLPFAPDWRWLLGRVDSPWYPTMRLFRQSAPGDWAGVIDRVCAALGQFQKALR